MIERHDIEAELEALAPWHFDLEVIPGLRTVVGNKQQYEEPHFRNISVIDPHEIVPLLGKIYPNSLKAKTFLDVACNGGGYCFVAKELGAEKTVGFDSREHWIAQAEFLKKHCAGDTKDMTFLTSDLYEFQSKEIFNISLFKGIFYHLPDPISGLKIIADLTEELIIIDTETDGERGDNCLRLNKEGKLHVMSGIHGLAWFPSGPDILKYILEWLGFAECREIFWKKNKRPRGAAPGRCRVIAGRSAEILRDFDRAELVPSMPRERPGVFPDG